MDSEKIGAAAGIIWERLRAKAREGCTLNELKRKTPGFTADEVVAGVGWLSREGKLEASTSGRKILLTLSTHEFVT